MKRFLKENRLFIIVLIILAIFMILTAISLNAYENYSRNKNLENLERVQDNAEQLLFEIDHAKEIEQTKRFKRALSHE